VLRNVRSSSDARRNGSGALATRPPAGRRPTPVFSDWQRPGSSGQARTVARLLAGLYNGADFPINPYELRGLDIALSDDVITCLDALRWAKADLHTLVPDGDHRTRAVLKCW
jgi:hypothetical protein